MGTVKQRYTLHQKGAFTVVWPACGNIFNTRITGSKQFIEVRYTVRLRCQRLDARGFVLAQEDIPALVKPSGPRTCEEMAETAAKKLWDAMVKARVLPLTAEVQLSPAPFDRAASAIRERT